MPEPIAVLDDALGAALTFRSQFDCGNSPCATSADDALLLIGKFGDQAAGSVVERHAIHVRLLALATAWIAIAETQIAEMDSYVALLDAFALVGGKNFDAPAPGSTIDQRRANANKVLFQSADWLGASKRLWYWRERKTYLEGLRQAVCHTLVRLEVEMQPQPRRSLHDIVF